MPKNVFVGMSGGVDSSVTAALLKERGYDVTGVFMKNWTQDLPGFPCPWKEDFNDAKRVAVQLGIPFKVYDFQDQYRQKVVDYMIEEYKAGRTPNPDIICNQEVKFKLFFDAALEDGAEMIATGHYARTTNGKLLTAKDENKDQTYFLYRVNKAALRKTLFPLGDFASKDAVRREAKRLGLVTAGKKDSQGICFVGKVGIREFLSRFVKARPGKVLDERGQEVGEHDGAIFYTIGQRKGLGIGGGLPYYVIGKDMDKNEVYVTRDISSDRLWSTSAKLTDAHWINNEPPEGEYWLRTRHRAPKEWVKLIKRGGSPTLRFKQKIRAITPGQSAVLYDDDRVVGGGIVV
ncbi:MAG: tRNA 2-thiouridine(34) synthase MnmA [Candidatus Saccharibacteria bacterium]|nr:tRNA 2-thiouridine(34) synthase MnmA [Candidatus Saccharibacteria bacterium]